MENASKALLIAGAILLAILIISLGIIVFQNAKGATNTSAVDELAVSTFNSKFTQYAGTKIRGANVNSLLEAIVSNNLTNGDDNSKQIAIKVTASNWSGTKPDNVKETNIEKAGKALVGNSYKVSFGYDSQSAYVNSCTIEDATN